MRNFKKLFCTLLVMSMLFTTGVGVFASPKENVINFGQIIQVTEYWYDYDTVLVERNYSSESITERYTTVKTVTASSASEATAKVEASVDYKVVSASAEVSGKISGSNQSEYEVTYEYIKNYIQYYDLYKKYKYTYKKYVMKDSTTGRIVDTTYSKDLVSKSAVSSELKKSLKKEAN